MGTESPLGEAANSTRAGNSTSCDDTGDGFINFAPEHLYFNIDVFFLLPADIPKLDEGFNDYATEENFGIIASDVAVMKYRQDGV